MRIGNGMREGKRKRTEKQKRRGEERKSIV
jgi:hypothetical protein